jgi:hypothetical protein
MNTRKAVRAGFSRQLGVALLVLGVAIRVALGTEFHDLTGPRVISAIIDNSPSGGSSFGSNTINVILSEPVNSSTARDLRNFSLSRIASTNRIPILSALYSAALGILLTVDGTNADWAARSDYVLTVNSVRDVRGNVIAPDTQVAVSWRRTTNVIQWRHVWRFYPPPFSESAASSSTNWYSPDFVEGPYWTSGAAPFCNRPRDDSPCFGSLFGCTDLGPFLFEPSLFRTWFRRPGNLPTLDTRLHLRFVVDDGVDFYRNGAIFYLNGAEIHLHNRPAVTVTLPNSDTARIIAETNCVTSVSLPVTNLVSGSNLLAVAVFPRSLSSDGGLLFDLELDINHLQTPSLSLEPDPVLQITRHDTHTARLSWIGHGYALESATNLNLGSASYPHGPWLQVSNLSNPYTNSLVEPARFFRLKK